MAVVVGEAAVRIRADVDPDQVEDDASDPILDALGSIGGKGAALLGGLLGGAALGSAFGTAMENEALGDKLNAQLGASGDYAADLGAIAGELYAGAYGENLGEVNDALRSVIQSGAVMEDATNEQLQSVTASAMDLASAFGVDVGEAARSAGRLVQTGLADNAEQAFDLITRGFQQGADTGGDFLDVLNEYGTTFQQVGLDGPAAVGLLNQALAAGIPNADFAADALREIGIRGREGSDAAATALQSLGLNANDYFDAMRAGGPEASAALDQVLDTLRNTEDPAVRAAAATELVGTQYEDLGDAILQLDPSEAAASLGTIEGAAASMGETLNDNAQTNLASFWRQAQGLFVDLIGGQVLPIVDNVTSALATNFGPVVSEVAGFIGDNLVPVVRDLATWIGNNETPILIVAGIIAAVFLPHLLALAAQAVLTGATTAAMWVASQVGAITAAAVHSAQVAMMIVRWVAMAGAAILNAGLAVGAWLGMGIAAVVNAGIVAAAWLGAQISTVASLAVMAAGFVVQGAIMVGSVLATVASVVAGWVVMAAGALLSAGQMALAWFIALGPIGWVIAIVVGLVALIIANWETVKNFTIGAFHAIVDFVVGAWNALVGAVSSGISTVVSFVTGLPGKILGALSGLGSLLVGVGGDLMRGLVNGISAAASFVGNVAKNIVNSIIGFVNDNIIDGINGLLEFRIAGITINPPDIPHIPKLHSGGVFDSGLPGGEGLALLRDDELVATPEQRSIANDFLGRLLEGRIPADGTTAPGAGAAPSITINENVYAAPGEPVGAIAARATQGVVWNLNAGISRPAPLGAST